MYKSKVLLFVLFATIALWTSSALPAYAADLLFVADFENASLDGLRCSGNCPSVVSSPTRNGSKATRFVLTRDMPTPYRSEVVGEGTTYAKFEYGKEYWMGFSFMLVDWKTDTSGEIIWQLHDTPQDWACSDNLSFRISTKDGKWNISGIAPGNKWYTIWSGDTYQTCVWIDWVIHAVWSTGDDGFVEVYKDGELIGNRTGPNVQKYDKCGELNVKPTYWKLGTYKWDWKEGLPATQSSRREVIYDEIRIGDADASYEDVAPRDSSPTIPQLLLHWLTDTFDQNGDGKVNGIDFGWLLQLQ